MLYIINKGMYVSFHKIGKILKKLLTKRMIYDILHATKFYSRVVVFLCSFLYTLLLYHIFSHLSSPVTYSQDFTCGHVGLIYVLQRAAEAESAVHVRSPVPPRVRCLRRDTAKKMSEKLGWNRA